MVSEKEGAGPISYGGVAGLAPSATERKCGLTQSIVPAGTPLREGWCHPARKPSNASPFAPQRTAERFFVRLSGVSPPRPKLGKAPRAASVNAGRKATAVGGAERGVDGREHGAIVDKAGPLMPPPPLPHRRARCQPACGAGSRPASWRGPLLPFACLRAWRASPPSSSRRRL